jgi:imidazolonepropionase
LLTIAGENRPRIGKEMSELGILNDAAIAVNGGRIVAIGDNKKIQEEWTAKNIIDANYKLVTPGFVDSHTHPVFAGSRESEFNMRVKGATYKEIAVAGGGIVKSVTQFRNANYDDIKNATCHRLERFLQLGTTTIEAKSGYGLDTETELQSLRIIKELKNDVPIDVVSTFLGAHDIPVEYRNNPKEYVRIVCEEMIPEVARENLASYCDVFCEKNVFELEDSEKILETAKKYNMKLKLHADELSCLGGAELAAKLSAVSADHLVNISDKGIEALAKAGVIAVLLPATTFFLGSNKYAPARKMVDSGVPVALATDFNPGSCMTQSMQLVLTIAGLYLHLSLAEVFVAATINGACAIGMEEEVGSLMAGKSADFVIWNAPNYFYIPYHFGDNLVDRVIKRGQMVVY